MNTRIKLLSIAACILLSLYCAGQDPHFSQYYASPVTVNPATTGYFTGEWRVSGIYRSQWAQYGDPFSTGTIAIESKIGKSRMEEGISTLAAGGMMMFDKTPGGIIKSQYFQGSIAYHQVLDGQGYHKIGLGFMAGLARKSLNLSNVTFGSQFTSYGFNLSLPNMEPVQGRSMTNIDLQTGILYSYSNGERAFYFGTSLYHIYAPKNYFYQKDSVQQTLPRRFTVNTGGNIVTDYLHFAVSALYMKQGNINYALLGGSVGMPFGDEGVFYPGLWYRVGEAIIPTVNLQFHNLNIGLSYEKFVNTKTFVKPTSLEISLIWRSLHEEPNKLNCFSF